MPSSPASSVTLCILDGWGYRKDHRGNAPLLARTPTMDHLWHTCPHALLTTHGEDVGLPAGQFGNSEVGHLNIGAGRVVMQDLPRISTAVTDGTLADHLLLARLAKAGVCHLMGLASTGGVHAHSDHLIALAKALAVKGCRVFLHLWSDGRDRPPSMAAQDIKPFIQLCADDPKITIATVIGRFYAMDRDRRWDRTALAWRALTQGKRACDGQTIVPAETAEAALSQGYEMGLSDEHIKPTVIGNYQGMQKGEGVLCGNFRADRVRQILTALLDPKFNAFAIDDAPRLGLAVTMTDYGLSLPLQVLFAAQNLTGVLGELVAKAGLSQVRAAETEKYPHVTYFLNGGREEPFAREDRIFIPSPKVATYDQAPDMSAVPLTDKLIARLNNDPPDLLVVNYANPDMVGHTGDLKSAITACETVDRCLGRLWKALEQQGGQMIVTADHGNCECMEDEDGKPHTTHTTNPVPIILAGRPEARLRDGRLADLAPTLLGMMNLPVSAPMTGQSLISP
ncbi:MAG: 2,3-bisphosphoglycerate-independent phosphoglycerate mutase [Pseudomonadota bacterium]